MSTDAHSPDDLIPIALKRATWEAIVRDIRYAAVSGNTTDEADRASADLAKAIEEHLE